MKKAVRPIFKISIFSVFDFSTIANVSLRLIVNEENDTNQPFINVNFYDNDIIAFTSNKSCILSNIIAY